MMLKLVNENSMYKFNGRKRDRQNDNCHYMFDTTPSYRSDIEEFIKTWNSHVWLPKITGSDLQAKAIRFALQRPFFRQHWRESFDLMAKSPYLWTKRRIKLDWYLEPEYFDKIIDLAYIDDKYRDAIERERHQKLNPNYREDRL